MPLAMRKKVFITAALTGSVRTQDRRDKVPRSPEQIADDAIEAAKAGAAVVIVMSGIQTPVHRRGMFIYIARWLSGFAPRYRCSGQSNRGDGWRYCIWATGCPVTYE